jgi:hypothetical protein
MVRPLRERPVDLFFVVVFSCFICTCILFDALNALNVPISPTSPNALARLMYEHYAKDTDLLIIANPFWVQLQLWVSAFLFAPFYACAIYALVKGRDWIHIPAIAFASAMTYSLVLYLGAQFADPFVSPAPVKILAANLPYAIVSIAFAYRMRKAKNFSE